MHSKPAKPGTAESHLRYLEMLVEAGELLAESIDYHETVQNACRAAVRGIADVCLLDLSVRGVLDLAASAHRDPEKSAELRGAGRFLRREGRLALHPVWHVISTSRPQLTPLIDDDYIEAHATSPEHEEFMRRMEFRSMVIVPVMSRTQGVLGALTLVRTGPRAIPYDRADLRFALDLGRRFGMAIGKSLLYSRTVQIATHFQRAALPRALPEIPGMHFDAFYEPSSEELLVGGDWYDAFRLPDGRVAITVGDVLGHGIEAAVWMSRLRNALRATLFTDPDAARALSIADRLMRLESQEDFTTALVAIIDPVHQTISCASAGHPGPLVWEPGGTVSDAFAERGLPLGLRALGDDPKTAQMGTLHTGCFIVFFTDGLLEWNRDIPAAWDRLLEVMHQRETREAEHPARAIRELVIDHARHQDDLAILTLRVEALVRTEVRP